MSGWTEIVLRGVRAVRRAALWWTVGVVAFVVINLAFWPSLEDSEALEAFGDMEALLEAFGAQNIATPEGYVDGQVFALLLPLLFSAMAITLASGLTAGDEHAGRLELLHALPVRREAIWLGRWTAVMTTLVAVTAISTAATVVSLPIFSLTEVSVGRVVAASAGSAVLAAFHGGVAYVVAGAGGSRGLSAGIAVAVLVAGYLAAFVLPIAESLSWVRDWSPWNWALGEQPVSNGVQPAWLLLVGLLAAALVALGTWFVGRRDIDTA